MTATTPSSNTHDDTKVDPITDRLHAAGISAARDTIDWWERRLKSYEMFGDPVLIASAKRQIAVQREWLEKNA